MNKTDSKRLTSPDWILAGAVLALVAIGLMMVYSSTYDMGYRLEGDTTYYVKRQVAFTAAGLVALLIAARVPYKHWTKLSIPIMVGAVLMLLAAVTISKSRQLLDQSVSPVELAKLAVVIYISHWLASKGDLLRKLPYGLLPFTIMVGVVAGLVMAQPDLSEALAIVLVAVAMFFLAGADVPQFVIGLVGGSIAFSFVITRIPQAMDRLRPFLEEWRDPLHSSNDQLREGLQAIGSGGLFGLGPGNGRMKFQWLPAVHTDSIFALVGEELGLIGCLAVILLFAIVAYRGFRIARRAPDSFGRLLAVGVTCMIVFQATINIAVVTGAIPFTGIALPFISVGGSSLLMCLTGVGIMLSVSRAPAREPAVAGLPDEAPPAIPRRAVPREQRPAPTAQEEGGAGVPPVAYPGAWAEPRPPVVQGSALPRGTAARLTGSQAARAAEARQWTWEQDRR
jgi:cell division protein FtsW